MEETLGAIVNAHKGGDVLMSVMQWPTCLYNRISFPPHGRLLQTA